MPTPEAYTRQALRKQVYRIGGKSSEMFARH